LQKSRANQEWVAWAIMRGDAAESTSDVPPSERPTVLMIGEALADENPGGLNRYLEDLASALEVQGTPVFTIRMGAGPTRSPRHILAAKASWPLPLRLLSYARAAARLADRIDVVDSHFALYGLLPVLATRLRSKPLVVHFHGPWAEESEVAGQRSRVILWVKRSMEAALYRRAIRLVTLSEAFKAILVERYRVDPSRIEVIAPGVDVDRFSTGDSIRTRRYLGLSDDGFVAVVVRRLDRDARRMGLDILLTAWSQVIKAVPGAMLLVVGDGSARGDLEERARQANISGSVRFKGRVDDAELVTAYQAADVSVVPSIALEGFGMVALESLACGTPVVVTDCGGLPEAVAGLDASLIVQSRNAGALGDRLTKAARGSLPDRQACRSFAEGFSWSACVRANQATYAQALDPRPRVVFLDHVARLSGGELALARLVENLDVDAHVILGEDGPLAERLLRAGAEVEVLPLPPIARDLRRDRVGVRPGAALASASYVAVLTQRLRRLRPDLVHANSLKSSLYGGVAARAARVPLVIHLRDRLASDYLPPSALRVAQGSIRYFASGLITNSTTTLETVSHRPTQFAVVPSGIPASWCTRPTPDRFGRATPLRVGMVGRIAAWKGQDVFLAAFAKAFPDGGAEAVIVGSALFGEESHEKELGRLAEDLGVVGGVRFSGFSDDVWGELMKLDVLVHASTVPEPFGQVVLEGMAAGLPVVAARAGGPAELITDGIDGLLFTPGQSDELARALRVLAEDPLLRQELGKNARQRASSMTIEASAAAVLELYGRVLGRGLS
jgi:glycosyltransferase involved in cell wall biosynthesis